ncbi:MAG: flagellar basal-body MS-ring/collar protein FliF [Anaerovoracaceae bacterium]|jgi:flagellar M-ring protein FliF
MNEQISKIAGSFKQFWANTSKSVKSIIIVGAILTLIVALVLSILMNTKDYVVLFDQLTATETSEILAQLQQMEVDVQLDSAGAITVPKQDESRVRMALATAGYPKSGLSYYMIEKGSGMLTTDYERQQYVNMQLQERIAASIKTLDGVKDAIVTITMPDENVFYLQEKDPPSASVIIHMQNGQALAESQILGIQNLVVKSVAGLTKENVAITDSTGNDLTGGVMANSAEFSKISITREIESDIRKKILSVLEGPYDRSKLRVSVTAVVDMDALFKEETLYTPSTEGGNTGVISQESRTEESSSSTQSDGGVPGTSSNSEVPVYPVTGISGESNYSSSSESTTYLVSQVISQFQKEGAKIESVSIGIAIDKDVFEPGEQERITRLVAHAVGVAPESIAVENFRFHSPDVATQGPPPTEKEGIDRMWLYVGIGAAALLAVIALVAAALLKKKRREEEVAAGALPVGGEALDELFGEEEPAPITPVKDVRKEQIREFAITNPEIAAQMIRSWLKSDEEE